MRKTAFDIRTFCDFDSSGRAECPSCVASRGKDAKKNLSLVPNTDGAYKCHRGCSPAEIRAALGAPINQQVPAALTKERKPNLLTPQQVLKSTDDLLASKNALPWLQARGIHGAMIQHYRLGVARAKVKEGKFLPAVSIPIPADAEGRTYYQKKRVAPWLPEEARAGAKPWSQYGIPPMAYFTHNPPGAVQTWLCEGEWDALMLGWIVRGASIDDAQSFPDVVAVACFTCGAGTVPPAAELAKLPGEVVVFYDRDKAGEEGARKVHKALGDRCRVARVPMVGSEAAPEGWDISDFLNGQGSLTALQEAAKAAAGPEPEPSKNPLRLRLQAHDELMATAADYTDWLVEEILTANELFLLAASPRAGKSLMAMTLAHSVATGGKFLGRPCSQGPVLYVRCEDSPTKTKERAIAQGWGEGLPIFWIDRFKLSELPHLLELVEEISPRLVVLDTLSRIKDSGISESSAEMSQLLEPLQNMSNDFNICTLLVHHTGKVNLENASQIDVFETIRGSSAIRGVCRGVLILAASDRKYRLCVENGWGKHDLDILLDANTLTWKLLGNWAGLMVDVSQKDRVLAYLTQVGCATLEQIADGTNLPKRSLYEVLRRLQSDEMLTKKGSRTAAVYVREAIQQIQHVESLLNSSNVDPVRKKDTFQQTTERVATTEKVIIAAKSYQPTNSNSLSVDSSSVNDDHFLPVAPFFGEPTFVESGVKTGSNVDCEGDSAIQQTVNKLSTVELLGAMTGGEPVEFLQKGRWRKGAFVAVEDRSIMSATTGKLENSCRVKPPRSENVRVAMSDIRVVG